MYINNSKKVNFDFISVILFKMSYNAQIYASFSSDKDFIIKNA